MYKLKMMNWYIKFPAILFVISLAFISLQGCNNIRNDSGVSAEIEDKDFITKNNRDEKEFTLRNTDKDADKDTDRKSDKKLEKQCLGNDKNFSITFMKTNNLGEKDDKGINHVIIFNPKSPSLEFKVNVGIAGDIYAKDNRGRVEKDYVAKVFSQLITEENAKLDGKLPIGAINADYIDTEDKPQGLNISRGVEYSGAFRGKRSSFGISGGIASQRKATIKLGKRKRKIDNYNVVGGNGRFYKNGIFKDICDDLGEFACAGATNRSMVAITKKGYVILLVNDIKADSLIRTNTINKELLPEMFDDVLEGIANRNCLGDIQEGMLFDGGMSPGIYYDKKIYVSNPGPIGSVFLIYKKE